MTKKYYIFDKENSPTKYGYINPQMNGFKIKPKNNIKYDGVEVSKLTLIEPNLIDIVLKRKTKRQLNAYLNFLLGVATDDDNTSPGDLGLVLDDAKRYEAIIMNKYAKFLDKEYIKKIMANVKFVEDELNKKIEANNKELEATKGKGR